MPLANYARVPTALRHAHPTIAIVLAVATALTFLPACTASNNGPNPPDDSGEDANTTIPQASDGDWDALIGTWEGSGKKSGQTVPIPVTLQLTSVKPGEQHGGEMKWNSTMRCEMYLEPAGDTDEGFVYTIYETPGDTPCTFYWNGYLTLRTRDAGGLEFLLSKEGQESIEGTVK